MVVCCSGSRDGLHDDERQVSVARQQSVGDGETLDSDRLQQLMNDNERLSRDVAALRTSLNTADTKSDRSVCVT